MFGIHGLWLFILSCVLLNVTPGPDSVYIIGGSMQVGWRGGAAAALGINCGCKPCSRSSGQMSLREDCRT
jgi:threonine/homoserine/homoserine lactone efflux protein